MAGSKSTREATRTARYEFRVWGEHKKARKELKRRASEVVVEEFEDCYLFTDDPDWNVKIRDNTLKLKRLVTEKKGFEQWASGRHPTVDSTPSPFDMLFEDLRLDRPQRGKSYNLPKEIRRLDPDSPSVTPSMNIVANTVFDSDAASKIVLGRTAMSASGDTLPSATTSWASPCTTEAEIPGTPIVCIALAMASRSTL